LARRKLLHLRNTQLEKLRLSRLSRGALLRWQCERFQPLLQCTPAPEGSHPPAAPSPTGKAVKSTQDAWEQQYLSEWRPAQVKSECKTLLQKCELEENPSEKEGYISVLL
jgi:hypothetical protein